MTVAPPPPKGFSRFVAWSRRVGLERKLALALLALAVASGIATYLALTGAIPAIQDPRVVLILLLINLVVLLLLGAVVARRLVALWLERRRGLAGARLHARLVLIFSLVAVAPAIIMAVFSALFLQLGMESWFSERVRTAVADSLAVAQAYLQEHQQRLATESVAMAQELRRQVPFIGPDRDRLERLLNLLSSLRSFSEAVVVDGQRRILARTGFTLAMEFDADLPDWAFQQAREGDVVILPSSLEDRVRALVQLDDASDTFLYVGRLVDPRVIAHLDKTRTAARLYKALEGRRSGLQITFAAIFFVVALLLLLVAIWLALLFANRLVRPVSRLVAASERIGAGDLGARVPESAEDDEISLLSRAFNRMTEQLESQRSALVNANRTLDERRRFMELVLSGVSAGVIGLDPAGRINLPNRSASDLLGTDLDSQIGRPLSEIVPEMGPLIAAAARRPGRNADGQISLVRGASQKTLHVRVAAEATDAGPIGYVVTFDDVTALLSAQRMAAWADIARRIAHEIKNPLTPIQLSAERLKRKYLKEIVSDPETFSACTDTIIRQVGDIGRMVTEFSAFARMPAPTMKEEDLASICRQALLLQQNAHPAITYHRALGTQPVLLSCDARQIGQALTNLLQNAAESIEARTPPEEGILPPGEIWVRLEEEEGRVILAVEDNGRGLPGRDRDRLTEPYVTTRAKGTGLGLAIVKKVMEDHGGELRLEDRPGGGASIKLRFVRQAPAEDRAADDAEPRERVAAGGG
ncbi:MAG: PAS domain-containing sensor histidine kinase [Rhodospirillaceae bacterium]|nr:PAS domain-containing sensor histidine kinase [Rhodospirillaceae bacterium]